ncbi:MAG: class I SAM-dependent methyltransferase [Thermoplasmata archaeon]
MPSRTRSPLETTDDDRRGACRGCGTENSNRRFLSLGLLPLGNAFIPAAEIPEEERFPLDMGFCDRCFLVQVMDPAPLSSLERVYRRYSYVPTGSTLAAHYRDLANDILTVVHPGRDALFVDIGSNDGLLLSDIRRQGPQVRIVGVEPSDQISEIATKRGVPTIHGFFDPKAAEELRAKFGLADVVSATQVFQHLREPGDFLRSVHGLLRPDGVLTLEGRAYFPDVAEKVSFDTFYHELLFCFTLRSLQELLQRADFTIFHAQRSTVYGGSLRVYAQKTGGPRAVQPSVPALLSAEDSAGLGEFETYRSFGQKVEGVGRELEREVHRLREGGKRVAGYGAPSTGNTLLNYCHIGPEVLEYIVDDNPLKQGLVTPGTHVPITDSQALEERPPEYVLLIAWRLRDEILQKLRPLKARGLNGVIVPLPKPEVIPL